jgi:hypothetical protein
MDDLARPPLHPRKGKPANTNRRTQPSGASDLPRSGTMQTRLADCGHRAEDLGTATGPTAVQGYNGRAESVGPMPASDPQRTPMVVAISSFTKRASLGPMNARDTRPILWPPRRVSWTPMP